MQELVGKRTLIDKEKLIQYITKFTPKKIIVIGDLILDKYTLGNCEGMSPEAPVPILSVKEKRYNPGGAGNTVVNIKTLGSKPYLIGILGQDNEAEIFKKQLEDRGIESLGIFFSPHTKTIIKERLVALKPRRQQLYRLDYFDEITQREEHYDYIANHLDNFLDNFNADTIVISDYAKGTLSESLIKNIIDSCRNKNKTIIVDPRPEHTSSYKNASFITPNLEEARKMAGINFNIDKDKEKIALAQTLNRKLNANIVLTMSEEGILFCNSKHYEHFETFKREVSDVSGAGDSVVAALAVGLANRLDINYSIYFANHAGGVKVEKAEVQPVSLEEIIKDITLHNS